MKLYAVLALVGFGFLASLFASSNATNTTWGYVGPYDQLMFEQKLEVKSSWLQVNTRNVVFPTGGHTNNRIITCIKAIDHMKKHGGRASLLHGGPGQRNATIHLKSERSERMNFTVQIWGR